MPAEVCEAVERFEFPIRKTWATLHARGSRRCWRRLREAAIRAKSFAGIVPSSRGAQMTYHLRRLRLHGLIKRITGTHRYQVTRQVRVPPFSLPAPTTDSCSLAWCKSFQSRFWTAPNYAAALTRLMR